MTAAKAMATVNMPENGMSVAAAWEKPIMPTVVGKRRSNQRAAAAPYSFHASQAMERVARRALSALGRRAVASDTPNSLKLRAAPQ